ncbi:MAG: glucose-6-phosphate dehydrogenase [Candidatus Woesearchaeota archaeon]|jgi:glucose-6-phosphate 1-dehydrogenase|nr:glucose-6-phosphate dehydrogenase [Candidatus Woesearchaeota archaeon]MDP7324486.1 glucose-6-phosphate dehydrogenase [Candidatus Woesearchaeota archaeon]MDP7458320.1 glucose-6-phosphate dehydrogenase [Candidatus Woesearchaeota archaeon]
MKPFTIIIFGSTGDLAKRKIIPALYQLHKKKVNFNAICIGRRPYTTEKYYSFATEYMKRPEKSFAKRISYFIADFQDEGKICLIPEYLKKNLKGTIICYLAVSPEYFGPIVKQLAHCGFVGRHMSHVRVVFEKPFGDNLKSARKLNKTIRSLFKENQIYRVDHFLGKEAVQNLLVLRFANQLFEHAWNKDHIEKVHIFAREQIGVGTRAGYYDGIGALKDMVQNHLMQLLSLVAMEEPNSFNPMAVRNEKLKVVRALGKIQNLSDNLVRGQYKGYLNEKGIAKGSSTETYVALRTVINNNRWRGVPFILETGKSLNRKNVGIKIFFKPVKNIFKAGILPNSMEITIEPKGDINFFFNAKEGGYTPSFRQVAMNFSSDSEFGVAMEAYEKLIYDIANGDQTLFTRADEIEASWKWIDGTVRRWKKLPLRKYKKGSHGPKENGKIIH